MHRVRRVHMLQIGYVTRSEPKSRSEDSMEKAIDHTHRTNIRGLDAGENRFCRSRIERVRFGP